MPRSKPRTSRSKKHASKARATPNRKGRKAGEPRAGETGKSKARASTAAAAGPKDIDTQFPNLAADRRWDREQHIRAAMAMGLTRQEAEQHADADMKEEG